MTTPLSFDDFKQNLTTIMFREHYLKWTTALENITESYRKLTNQRDEKIRELEQGIAVKNQRVIELEDEIAEIREKFQRQIKFKVEFFKVVGLLRPIDPETQRGDPTPSRDTV